MYARVIPSGLPTIRELIPSIERLVKATKYEPGDNGPIWPKPPATQCALNTTRLHAMWTQRAVKSNEGNDVGRPPAALNTATSNLTTAGVGFRSKLRAGVTASQ